jgi:hypothetical protein
VRERVVLKQYFRPVAFILACFLSLQTLAENVGGTLSDVNLVSWQADLDKNGIDVRADANSLIFEPEKPVVMPLEKFNSGVDAFDPIFQELFYKGYQTESALFAVDTVTGRRLASQAELKPRWESAKPGKRVFISFSSKDLGTARLVENILIGKGYSTYIYLREIEERRPNVVETGRYFREADFKYVIDTKNSRESTAIAVEAYLATGRRPEDGFQHRIVPPPAPCCQWCETLNGVPTGNCGPVECGPQCGGAIKDDPFNFLRGGQ